MRWVDHTWQVSWDLTGKQRFAVCSENGISYQQVLDNTTWCSDQKPDSYAVNCFLPFPIWRPAWPIMYSRITKIHCFVRPMTGCIINSSEIIFKPTREITVILYVKSHLLLQCMMLLPKLPSWTWVNLIIREKRFNSGPSDKVHLHHSPWCILTDCYWAWLTRRWATTVQMS